MKIDSIHKIKTKKGVGFMKKMHNILASQQLKAVNGGTVDSLNGFMIELLGGRYSTHPDYIAVVYIPEDQVKTTLCYCGTNFVLVEKYRTFDSLEHYWSKNYNLQEILRMKKYQEAVKTVIEAYNLAFRR